MSIVLVDASADALTISWPGTSLADGYVLEFRTSETNWERLSDDVRLTQVKKKNLDPLLEYYFRVAAWIDDGPGEWMTHEEGFYALTAEEAEYAMAAPVVKVLEPGCLIAKWESVEGAYAYELQMRVNEGGADWFTVADELDATSAKKRNLTSPSGYCFRVRQLNGEYDEAFSPPSEAKVAVAPVGRKSPKSGVRKQHQPAAPTPASAPPNMDDYSMPAPWVKNAGPQALLIRWTPIEGATGYELQMRENKTKGEWATIAANLSGSEVKKKNLTSKLGYQFRVRPLGIYEDRFSIPSYGAIASQAPVRGGRRQY
eukprot:Nitzschia sp. Nitz4//scaffold27_size158506//154007//154948//NITZ4_002628-RA/size158506-processed-gene-0.62-mRNA-1//1//CDS//3329545572//7084//frame0